MPTRTELGTIWIVDDSVTDTERVSRALEDLFIVKTFTDGAAALESLSSSALPDILLLDWVMPGMSGVDITRYIRSARPPICQIPIILLTAQHGPEEINEAFKSGANDYIVKPFVDEELRARVKTLTSSKRHLERAQNLVKALQRSEERLLLATSSAGVGIWEWDIQTGVITSTDIHRKIFDLLHEGPISFDDLFDTILPQDREMVRGALNSAIEAQSNYSVTFQIKKADGSVAWVFGNGQTISDENGKPLRIVGIHLDISAQKKSEEDLKKAKEDAERANKMKSAFLANMSHEIRTPLGAMLGFAHLMKDPTVTEMELSQYLEVLTRNGEQLSVIINDILDLSKVEAGLLTYEHREFSPSNICHEVVSLFSAKAREQKLKLEYVCDPSTPNAVTTDPTRLRQILMNLVSNAVKFTKIGSVMVTSSGSRTSTGTKCLTIEVADTGIGVPAGQEEKIFEMFVQGDDSMTRKFGGTGIGLALSRQLARELGGDLKLSSPEQGAGSIFRATVLDHPYTAAAAETPQNNMPKAGAANITLKGVRVLVVDDSLDNQQLLSLYLTKRGASVDIASNGIEGFQKALSVKHDVILMDLQMPQMDGYETTKKLREVGYEAPIIALTAHAMSEISEKCLQAGCTGFLPKPINPSQLLDTIALHSGRL